MSTFQPISESESQIMEIVWREDSPITSAEIIQLLSPTTDWKPSTVWTFLGRLVEKGYLRAEKAGKKSLYYPSISKEMYLQMQTEHFLKTVHGGSVKSFFASLTGNEHLDKSDFSTLKQWISDQTEEDI